MKTATVLKKKLTKRQMIIIGAVVAVPLLVGIVYGIYILLQQTAITSRASEEAPANVIVAPSENNTVQVKWNTGVETSAILEYGSSPDSSTLTKVAISETPSTDHTVNINELEPGTYYFQIRIGDTVFDNNGLFWSFTIPEPPDNTEATPSATIEPEVTLTVVPTPTVVEASPSATIEPTSAEPTPDISPNNSICSSTNCSQIQSNLGTICTTQDYLKCVFSSGGSSTNPNSTPTTTRTPTPTGNNAPTPTNATSSTVVSTATKKFCKPTFLQANSCSSWSWSAMGDIDKHCADTYTKYFVQCKNTSFSSTDKATWYCNKTVTGTDLTLPCDNAPTPPAGQSIFCRVRAETASGGSATATEWVYASSTCSAYNSANIQECEIPYLQSNNCRSWIWGLNNNTNPKCAAAFSKYFFQCTDNGNFAMITTTPTPRWWFCNTTTEDHFLGLPCYNAATPADGQQITCRVRAEDSYGGDDHSTAWVYRSDTCPTSTPTPSITATPTHTPTPTHTSTPTPTP